MKTGVETNASDQANGPPARGSTGGWRGHTTVWIAVAAVGVAVLLIGGAFMLATPRSRPSDLGFFAGPISIVPPYTHTILLTTTTWAVGAGSLVWPGSPTAFVASGQVILDEHSTAAPAGGHYGGNAGEAGFIDTYACGVACGGKTHITFNWTVATGVWWTQYYMNCTGGAAQAEFATYGQVWQGSTLVAQAIMTVSDLFSTTFGSWQIVTGTGTILPVLTFALPGPGFVNGTSYVFDSFVWSQGSAYCPANSTGAGAYSEVDIGNRGHVALSSIILS